MNTRISFALAIAAAAGVTALAARALPQFAARLPASHAVAFEEAAGPSPSSAHLTVYVAGAVARPGVYDVPAGSRAVAALRAAGGPAPGADLRAVNLAARVEDGAELLVPKAGESADNESPAQRHAKRKGGRAHGRRHGHRLEPADSPPAPIDLNSADAAALARVPGIGASLADRIVTFREMNGHFERLDDLLDVGGMSQRRLDSAEPYLRL